MAETRNAHGRSAGRSDRGGGISRRIFMRALSLFSLTALAGPRLLDAATIEADGSLAVAAPQTEPTATAALLDILKNRKSERAFDPRPLPPEVLTNLLWAAFGINRPESGKRTAPSAMNWQEIDVYVLRADGASVYDAGTNALKPVTAEDLRATAGARGSMKDAGAHLIYVADYARTRGGGQAQKELFSAAHCGFIGQNVYLFCAAEGLATCFHASADRAALKESLKLRGNQAVIFAQVVGYPQA